MNGQNVIDLTKKLARHPSRKYALRRARDIKGLVLHCTDNNWGVEELAQRDITPGPQNPVSPRGCPECTYHYYVDYDGKIYHTVNDNKVTWHAAGYNTKTLSMVIRYTVTGNPNPPPEAQLKAAYRQLARLALKYRITPDSLHLRGHRELKGTGYIVRAGHKRLKKTCPGLLINLDNMRVKIGRTMQKIMKNELYYDGEIDGIFGPRSLAALSGYGRRR